MRRMAVKIINNLKRDRDPEAKHNNEQHGHFKYVVYFFGKEKVTYTKYKILAVEDYVVNQVAYASRARF